MCEYTKYLMAAKGRLWYNGSHTLPVGKKFKCLSVGIFGIRLAYALADGCKLEYLAAKVVRWWGVSPMENRDELWYGVNSALLRAFLVKLCSGNLRRLKL
jgi:hypothetical protein